MSSIVTRMGDGSTVRMARDEIRREILEGSEAAAVKARIPVLEENEVDYLVDMFCCPSRVWGVERGHEAVMTKDGGTNTLISSRLSSGIAAPIGRETAVRLFERAFAFDSMEVGHLDYSVKPSKFIVSVEMEHMELVVAALLVVGLDHQNAGELTVGPCRGLQADPVHARDVEEGLLGLVHQAEHTLHFVFCLVRMQVAEAREAGHLLVEFGVVLHGAGAQWIEPGVDRVVKVRQSGEVAHDLELAELR